MTTRPRDYYVREICGWWGPKYSVPLVLWLPERSGYHSRRSFRPRRFFGLEGHLVVGHFPTGASPAPIGLSAIAGMTHKASIASSTPALSASERSSSGSRHISQTL